MQVPTSPPKQSWTSNRVHVSSFPQAVPQMSIKTDLRVGHFVASECFIIEYDTTDH